MESETKTINVMCPFCKKEGSINVPTCIYSNKKWGVVKIQVPAGAICTEHQFIVLIDPKGIVRGHEKIEYLTGNEAGKKAQTSLEKLTLNKIISLFGVDGFANILHAKIFKYPIYIAKNEIFDSLEDSCKFFFNQIIPELYRENPKINFIEGDDIVNIAKEEIEAYIQGSQQNVVQSPWKEKLKFENSVIEKALGIIVQEEQMIIIQQEISKLVNNAESARDILDFSNNIQKSEFLDLLQKEMRVQKVSKNDLLMIKNFIDRRFAGDLWTRIGKK